MMPRLLKFLPVCLLVIFVISSIPASEAHLPRIPHYNGGSQLSGGYLIMFATEPEYVRPSEQADFMISVQDTTGKDLHAVKTAIKIFKNDELFMDLPLAIHATGDFREKFTFSEAGIYQVQVDVYGSQEFPNSGGDVVASAMYNIFVSQWLGQIFNSVITVAIVTPLVVLGVVLASRTKTLRSNNRLGRDEIIQYVAVLTALAAGMMHVVLFADHSAETIFYGVFFIFAGFSQMTYGVLFMMVKKKVLNYIGLVGTIGIIGLYIYAVILPPPLHSTPSPEHVEIIGIAVKTMESVMLIALVYIIYKDRKRSVKVPADRHL